MMDRLNLSFWLGLVLAVPLSVLANILTPRILQWIAERDGARAQRQMAVLQRQLEELERLNSSPGQIQTYLLESVLAITLLTSTFGVLSGFMFAVGMLFPGPGRVFLPMGQFAAVCGGAIVAKECFDALRKSGNARHLEKSRAEIDGKLKKLR